jgi:molybdopterin/thiamine biosynthesis adenylyltransferase
MLSDAAIERYSRQILLPEVGGRGQERLCAARAAVAGSGAVAAVAIDLLARAGVRVTDAAGGGTADVLVDLTGGAHTSAEQAHATGRPLVVGTPGGAGGVVDTWLAGPCDACAGSVRDSVPDLADDPALAAPAAIALGALVAAETLVALLGVRAAGRRQTVDLAAGILTGVRLAPRPGCAVCASAA